MVSTKWQGPSPFKNAKNEAITITFETANRLRWSKAKSEYYQEYEKNEGHFKIQRKHPLIIKVVDDETLTLQIEGRKVRGEGVKGIRELRPLL